MYFALVGMMHNSLPQAEHRAAAGVHRVKMLLPMFDHQWQVSNAVSLAVIGGVLLLV